jgi:hypothetical protein
MTGTVHRPMELAVPIFCEPGRRHLLAARAAAHLAPDGVLVCGWAAGHPAGPTAEEWAQWCADEGLAEMARWSTWDRDSWNPGGYVVAVHRLC